MFECPRCQSRHPWPLPSEMGRCPHCAMPYRQVDGVLTLEEPTETGDFPEAAYEHLVRAEDRHFWFHARNRVIRSALRAALGGLRGVRALDIGCGTGQVLAFLEREGLDLCGLDMHAAALRWARKRTGAPLVCIDARRAPFREEFDLVMLCDVLEHLVSEAPLLEVCARALRPGGALLATVPAGPGLWSPADGAAGHKRRYSRLTLKQTLEHAGFRTQRVDYFNSLIAPLLFLWRSAQRAWRRAPTTVGDTIAADLAVPPWPLNAMLLAVGTLEAACLPWLSLPWGASLVAVAHRE